MAASRVPLTSLPTAFYRTLDGEIVLCDSAWSDVSLFRSAERSSIS